MRILPNPSDRFLGPVDGFIPVSGIEDPNVRQLYVPGAMHKYETLIAADMLTETLQAHGIDHVDDVIGLSRGGMAIGAELSYANMFPRVSSMQISGYDEYNNPYTEAKIVRVPYKRNMSRNGVVVIGDDLIDSGKAMRKAVDWADRNLRPRYIFSVVLYTKDRDRVMDADVSVRMVRNEWHDYAVQADKHRRALRIKELARHEGLISHMAGRLEMMPVDRMAWLALIADSAGKYIFPHSQEGDDEVTMKRFPYEYERTIKMHEIRANARKSSRLSKCANRLLQFTHR